MTNNLISVIVPVYNVEKYLERCIESIVNQTYQNLEIILVDDGSTDNSPLICDEWSQKDSRIKVIHKENGGLSSARNAGLDCFEGDFLLFIDSDDEIVENAVELLYRAVNENSCDMAVGRYALVENDAEVKSDYTDSTVFYSEDEYWTKYYELYFSKKTSAVMLYVSMIISCCKLIKREVFRDLKFDLNRIHEDEFIIHKIVKRCDKIAFLDTKLYLYYQNSGSITKKPNAQSAIDVIDAHRFRYNYFASTDKKYTFWALYQLCNLEIMNFFRLKYEMNDNEAAKKLEKDFKKYFRLLNKKTLFSSLSPAEIVMQYAFYISARFYKLLISIKKLLIK